MPDQDSSNYNFAQSPRAPSAPAAVAALNYFNYFTEIEERFQRRRGTTLLLSTLDWALIESWKDAGIPLDAVLRGIDAAFEKFQKRPSVFRKVNSLAYCSQAVLEAAEQMKEAEVGARGEAPAATSAANVGIDRPSVSAYLRRNSAALAEKAGAIDNAQVAAILQQASSTIAQLALELDAPAASAASLEDLERRLTVLEERINAALLASTPEAELLQVRTQADRELAPYRRHMIAPQIEQLQRQYVSKRLLERHGLPRLSLFYM
ncbi:MAG TPA: hypothetical protein VE998_04880 [Terriglobales bacterium]|nr:hypothetical protein [Terriglobales bacterium]